MSIAAQLFTTGTLFVILMKVAPLILASLGGAFTQQGNVLNIGMEGMMLIGAFSAIAVGSATHSALLGVLAAVASGFLLSLIFALASLTFKADVIVVGIGVNLLAAGLSVFLLQVIYGNPGTTPPGATIMLPRVSLGPLASIPILGPALNNQTPLVWLALFAVPIAWFVLYKSTFGVHLRAVGEDENAARAAGIKPTNVQFQSILIAGLLSGLAGAQLSMATLGSFTADMSAGRGFICVAAITFGLARPIRTTVAAFIFGTAEAVADQLSVAGVNSNLALMTPYVVTIIALVFVGVQYASTIKRRRALAVKKFEAEAGGVPVAAAKSM